MSCRVCVMSDDIHRCYGNRRNDDRRDQRYTDSRGAHTHKTTPITTVQITMLAQEWRGGFSLGFGSQIEPVPYCKSPYQDMSPRNCDYVPYDERYVQGAHCHCERRQLPRHQMRNDNGHEPNQLVCELQEQNRRELDWGT